MPEYAGAWQLLGVAYRLTGQTGKVTEVHRRLQQLDSEMADRFFTNVVLP